MVISEMVNLTVYKNSPPDPITVGQKAIPFNVIANKITGHNVTGIP